VRVATLLKQVSANAVAGATGDQASDHTATSVDRPEFELNITESLPTRNQLATILEYVASPHISTIVKGASTQAEALRKFQENSDNFQRPVVRIVPLNAYGNGCILISLYRLSIGTMAELWPARTSHRFYRY